MNVLVIGQNGREHALAETYAKSKRVKKVIITPGNGLTDLNNKKIKNYPEVSMTNFDGIVNVCEKESIDLVDVAQDDSIAAGYVDRLQALGIKAFGPTQKASQLEWDKAWSRSFMQKYDLPIPEYRSFSDIKSAKEYVQKLGDRLLFIKAYGLAFGKGVIRTETKEQAYDAIDQMKSFGKAGETFLIEEGLIGEEFSLFAICDGKDYVIAKSAQDHKTAFDNDLGPNTGGMGSVAPALVATNQIIKEVEDTILKPLMSGMEKEGRPYKGILYLGAMVTSRGVKIIEFNCRWGDPEAEVILSSIEIDYYDLVDAVINQRLSKIKISFDEKTRISVAGCANGYPSDYTKVKGKEILGLETAMEKPGITIFGSGIKRVGKKFSANGGRLFYVIGEGKDVIEARKKTYEAMSLISIEDDNLHYRTDIGWRDVERLQKK